MSFKKAERKQAKLKLAITGPSGSGKTFSALRLARGLGGRVAVIDTENGSASLYSDRFEFDVLELKAPYTTPKYLEAVDLAVKGRYDVLVIDSLTHQWAGEGGLLNKKEQLDARGGNSFANWGKLTPEYEKFKAALLHADLHLIGTIRSKTEYTITEKDGGKGSTVRKLGSAPVQRDGLEYEFTTVFDVAMNHEASASKDRTGLFADRITTITESTGEEFKAWLDGGAKEPAGKPPTGKQESTDTASTSSTNPAMDRLEAARVKGKWLKPQVTSYLKDKYGVGRLGELTEEQFNDLVNTMENNLPTVAFAALAKQEGTR